MIHMLTIYRRHLKSCPHVREGRDYRRCKCPIHVEGTLEGISIRKALDTTNWQRATEIIREWEANGMPVADTPTSPPTISEACERFKADAAARKLKPSTLKKYRVLTDQFTIFCEHAGPRYLSQLTLADVEKFRESWRDQNIAARKKLERLKAMYRFFANHGWTQNLAQSLRPPVTEDPPTLPFTKDETARIMAAVPLVPCAGIGTQNELAALVLLLRYSGLRFGDAVQLHESRLSGNHLLLYTAKTRVPVFIPLPEFVAHRLDLVKRSNGYFFATGNATAETDCSNWRRRFRKLFRLADVPDGHPHRFRDTFAVGMLQADVTLEQLSILLGHRSIRVTEKHYAPWVKSRQEQLERAVMLAHAHEDHAIFKQRELAQ